MCALGRYRHSLGSLAWLDFSYLPTHTARKVGRRRLLIIANNNNNHEFGLNEMCVVAPNSAHTLKAVAYSGWAREEDANCQCGKMGGSLSLFHSLSVV